MPEVIDWLMESGEPWTRYRTLVDLLDRPEADGEVREARQAMLADPRVRALVGALASRGERPLRRHNDAGHPIYALSTLADFGLRASDPGMEQAVEAVLTHQSAEGAFQSLLNVGQAYGGTGEDAWAWMACDAPTLLYALEAMGVGTDGRVRRAAEHLARLAADNGWRCAVAPELGRFHGPGRRADPCPVANVYALKALSLVPGLADSPAVRAGVEMLLGHWAGSGARPYLFGAGSDYRKLKYPFVWYDILHVAEALSRLPAARGDARFQAMVSALAAQADGNGRYTAGSMYKAWQGWSFADKKAPSPWLTLLALRVQRRVHTDGS